MKIAFHNTYEGLNPVMFHGRNAPIGDDLLLPLLRLKERARECDVEVGTTATVPDPDAIVFLDFPASNEGLQHLDRRVRKFLVTFENNVILPINFERATRFEKVFTWHDGLVAMDRDKYVKINYAQDFPRELPPAGPRDLCCLVASNKHSAHPLSYYPERVRAIRWFEQNALDSFTLYGPGWHGHPSWRGVLPAGTKRVAMRHFKFSIVIENARTVGYITEKIFDAMIAGCVPVYLGAPNVADWIPDTCFVDLRDFSPTGREIDYARLHATIKELDPEPYREAAIRWMNGPAADPFRCETFADTILDHVTRSA